jgi:hypothetical protein
MFSSNASSVSGDANFVEDVFSTFLYTGNGTSQTITNGVDLAGEGGLVWVKSRTNTSGGATSHALVDSARGIANWIATDATGGNANFPNLVTAFNASGFSVGNAPFWANENTIPYTSWTFREQPKFFDVVTYTGNGSSYRTITHALGSTPGVVIAKRTDSSGDWFVWHTSLGKDGANSNGVYFTATLNTTGAAFSTVVWGDTRPSVIPNFTGTEFSVGGNLNLNGATFVAYLFAHNAGGFGLTGTDNVISCGSYTLDGSGNTSVNLGYEAQWILYKNSNTSGTDWFIADTMRGASLPTTQTQFLKPNLSNAEQAGGTSYVYPTASGFNVENFGASQTFIYIAIRRGPMKVPTTGTSVFAPVARAGTNSVANVTSGFPTDLFINLNRDHLYFANNPFFDRLRGLVYSNSNSTAAEFDGSPFLSAYGNTGVTLTNSGLNSSATTYITYSMARAPGFFDEVCYSGNGTQALTHNLGVVPEMFILKNRAGGTDGNWIVYHAAVGNTAALQLNLTAAPAASSVYFANTSPTSTVFTVGTNQSSSGGTYVAYLFASAPGVSKVGSYTGNGSNQTINCGFTGGARFVMIKRTDNTGDWYVWDTARGIVSGNDPHLSLNTTAAEVTTDDTIDTDSTGFVVNQVSATNVNVSSATYIFLAIA